MELFFLKTLLHLGFQLTLTGLTANNMRNEKISRKWLWFIVMVGLLFTMQFTEIPLPIRFIMFCMFSIINGFILSSFLKFASAKDIQSAIFYTIFIFVSMVFVGFTLMKYNIDLSPLMLLVSIYSITMLIVYLYMIIFTVEKKTRQYIKLASIALFSLYIIIDTYLNLNKEYNNDIVISTLDYYTDIVSIFQNLLSYFSNDEIIK